MTWTLEKIADRLDIEFKGDGTKNISGVAPFDEATGDQITYAEGPKYLKRIEDIDAGAVIVPPTELETKKNLLISENPKVAFARVMELFYPPKRPQPGINPGAVIGEHFRCGENSAVGPLVAMGNDVTIGDRVVLHPGVVLGDGVVIGDDSILYPNVSILADCRIGCRVIIHAGTVIGSDGFGFSQEGDRHVKIPQVGIVRIDDDVEIGANNTIDRATFGETRIGCGVKTDNGVHIGHNVTVGENTLIIAQTIIGGSAKIGKGVIIAGGAAISQHVSIGDGAIVGPMTGVAKPVPAGQVVSGAPEMPHRTWLRVHRVLPNLPELKKRLQAIEKQLSEKNGS